MADVTQILSQIEAGDSSAAERILPLVYAELRQLAAAKLANEKPGQTLQPTSLVHEAYVRLVEVEKAQHWKSRGHFFSAAAEAMRRILIESARRRKSLKRGGQFDRIELAADQLPEFEPNVDLLALDEALDAFAAAKPRHAELVKLRYFGGLTTRQAADALGISVSTADADWAYAKSWLRLHMST